MCFGGDGDVLDQVNANVQAQNALPPVHVPVVHVVLPPLLLPPVAVPPAVAHIQRADPPIDPVFTPGNLLFASGAGDTCSLYFNNGRRIRLVHGHGPHISAGHHGLVRYVVTPAGYQTWRQMKQNGSTNAAIVLTLTGTHDIAPAAVGAGGRLLELWGNTGNHPSRGGPVAAPNLNQYQINVIYTAAQTGNNGTMQACYAYAIANP